MFEGHIIRLAQCRPGKCEINPSTNSVEAVYNVSKSLT